MLISDFTLKARNTAKKGETPRMEVWQPAAGGNLTAIGYLGGKKYQIKLHASEPKWYYTEKAIAKKQAVLSRAKSSDKPRIQSEIATLMRSKARHDRNDAIADGFFSIKTNLISALNAIGDPLIVAPVGIWKQEIDFRGNGVFAVEATPWAEHAYMGGDEENSPLVFSRDPTQKQQYELMASLAGRLAKLHENGIIHGDLKIGNTLMVVVDGRFQAALIDFDAAINLNDLYSRKFELESWSKAIGGTYFSPELFELCGIISDCDEASYSRFDLKTITDKSDIFSLGVTVYEYFFGRADLGNFMPFVNEDGDRFGSRNYCEAIEQGYRLELPDKVNDFLYGIIGWMLDPTAKNRPTARQVESAFRSGDVSVIPEQYRRGHNGNGAAGKKQKAEGSEVLNKFESKLAKMAEKVEQMERERKMIERSRESVELHEWLLNRIETFEEKTNDKMEAIVESETEKDDAVFELYKVLVYHAVELQKKLTEKISQEIQSDNIAPQEIEESFVNQLEQIEAARNITDTILANYMDLCDVFDDVNYNFKIYLPTDKEPANNCLTAIDSYEDELFDLSDVLKASGQSDWENVFGLYENASAVMGDLYAKAKEAYNRCRVTINDFVYSDVQKIEQDFEFVKPSVPEFSAEAKIYTPTISIGNMFVETSEKVLNNSGIATLGISTIFEPYAGMTFDELNKRGILFKWCSLNVFKAHGLISRDAQAVFIVDDGYEDFDVDKTAFGTMAVYHRAFSPDDNGRIFFSESAMKKFRKFMR